MQKKKNYNLQPLDSYIDQAMYDPKNGYYIKKNPFGARGDFITSPSISIIFSEVLTVWIILFWKNLKSPKKFNVVELGAGNGDMILEILKTSKKFENFKKSTKFYIYEKSEFLIKLQKKKLKNYSVKWIKDIKELGKKNTLFIGNEFLDSFPIKQFEKIGEKWFEKYVKENSRKRKLVDIKTNTEEYKKMVGFDFLKDQEFFEISFNQVKLLKKLSKFVIKNGGGLLFIDYGYDNLKSFNTIQAIKNHQKTNFLENKGDSDITHLINFGFLKKMLKINKLKISGYTTQGEYLKKIGIFERAEIISKNQDFIKKADIFYRIKRLTNENGMGKRFKVLFASNNKDFKVGF